MKKNKQKQNKPKPKIVKPKKGKKVVETKIKKVQPTKTKEAQPKKKEVKSTPILRKWFFVATNAWWKKHLNDDSPEIHFGVVKNDGEVCVIWEKVDGKVVPQLKAYDDSWAILGNCTSLINEMAKFDSMRITPEQFVALLKKDGFKERT